MKRFLRWLAERADRPYARAGLNVAMLDALEGRHVHVVALTTARARAVFAQMTYQLPRGCDISHQAGNEAIRTPRGGVVTFSGWATFSLRGQSLDSIYFTDSRLLGYGEVVADARAATSASPAPRVGLLS